MLKKEKGFSIILFIIILVIVVCAVGTGIVLLGNKNEVKQKNQTNVTNDTSINMDTSKTTTDVQSDTSADLSRFSWIKKYKTWKDTSNIKNTKLLSTFNFGEGPEKLKTLCNEYVCRQMDHIGDTITKTNWEEFINDDTKLDYVDENDYRWGKGTWDLKFYGNSAYHLPVIEGEIFNLDENSDSIKKCFDNDIWWFYMKGSGDSKYIDFLGFDTNKIEGYEEYAMTGANYKRIADEIIKEYGKPVKITYYKTMVLGVDTIVYGLWYKLNGYTLIINISESGDLLTLLSVYYMPEKMEQKYIEQEAKDGYEYQVLYDNSSSQSSVKSEKTTEIVKNTKADIF